MGGHTYYPCPYLGGFGGYSSSIFYNHNLKILIFKTSIKPILISPLKIKL